MDLEGGSRGPQENLQRVGPHSWSVPAVWWSHLAGVLLFESRRLLQEKSEGVAELRSGPGLDVLAGVDDFPATRRDTQRPR